MDATSSARWADTLAVFDLETTGIDVDTCRIVTAHVGVIGADGEELERHEWLAAARVISIDRNIQIWAGKILQRNDRDLMIDAQLVSWHEFSVDERSAID